MAPAGFCGPGNMGRPLAKNLLTAGHAVKVFDPCKDAIEAATAAGAEKEADAVSAAKCVEAVITMPPAGRPVLSGYEGDGGVIAASNWGTLLIDRSTSDMNSARQGAALAAEKGMTIPRLPVD